MGMMTRMIDSRGSVKAWIEGEGKDKSKLTR